MLDVKNSALGLISLLLCFIIISVSGIVMVRADGTTILGLTEALREQTKFTAKETFTLLAVILMLAAQPTAL